ncbi:PREDICTED: glutathione S-transferase T2-like [Erythranthe guttata]|uniref:glutathione S-transferase T2-like n=1 Tax=Erythranthe guttata TaxID=4155 RepID=UPI00064E0878|nr:PREDICTED: glutathione S-transferase T2-like [Erythranthe guttata]|eukprot:XP_012851819.1 PREDICTED: glutathione S-transferase T2-like [Erythranthe guttata]
MKLERVELLAHTPLTPHTSATNFTSPARLLTNISDLQNYQKRKPRTANFSREEDVCIVSAWLSTSKSSGFWQRIHDKFIIEFGQGGRTEFSLTSRWGVINAQCAKFITYLNQINNEHRSDQTTHDSVERAGALYAADNSRQQFKFEHCFDLLKYEKKWLDTVEKNMQRNKSFVYNGVQISSEENSEPSSNKDQTEGKKTSRRQPKRKQRSPCIMSLTHERWKIKMAIERVRFAQERKRLIVAYENAIARRDLKNADAVLIRSVERWIFCTSVY